MLALLLTLSLISAGTAYSGEAAVSSGQSKLWFVTVVSTKYYEEAARKGGIGAELRVVDLDDLQRTPVLLYMTEDTNIVVGKVGGFKFKGMNEGQFRKFFAKVGPIGVRRTACDARDRERKCVSSLVAAPGKAK